MGFFSFLGGSNFKESDYTPFIEYFRRRPLGSEPPVMTILSNLPPKDRCAILAGVLKNDPSNFDVYDKLSMAYLKNNQISEARKCLEQGHKSGNLSSSVYNGLVYKIDSMNEQYGGRFGSSTNYDESVQHIERDYGQTKNMGFDFSEFVNIAKVFCEKRS